MKIVAKISAIVLFIFVLLGFSFFYTVREGQNALLLRLGKITVDSKTGKSAVIDPGLHFKLPIINTPKIFDTRLQTLDVKSSRIPTKEQKYVLVDYYAKWRIKDLPVYYTRTSGQLHRAELLLSQQINDGLRNEFGKHTINEVVTGERTTIMSMLKEQANAAADVLGIVVIDVRIKRIDLPTKVSDSVYQRMRTKREQVATRHRADGKKEAEGVRAAADRAVTEIIANAHREAQQVRASGDGIASDIYAKAYNRDPKFYAFYRSLQSYQAIFSQNQDMLVLNPDSQFFKYFKSAVGTQNHNES